MSRLSNSTPPPLLRASIDSDSSTVSSSPTTPRDALYDPEMASPAGPDFSSFTFRQGGPAIPQKSPSRKSFKASTQQDPMSPSRNGLYHPDTSDDLDSISSTIKIRKISVSSRTDAQQVYAGSPVSFSRRVSVASLNSAQQLPGPASMSRSVSYLAQRRGSTMSFEMRRESIAEKRTMQATLAQTAAPPENGRRMSTTADVLGTSCQSHWSNASDDSDSSDMQRTQSSDGRLNNFTGISQALPADMGAQAQYNTVRRVSIDRAVSRDGDSPFMRAHRVSIDQARRRSRQVSTDSSCSATSTPSTGSGVKTALMLAREQAQQDALQVREAEFVAVMAKVTAAHQQERKKLMTEVVLLRRRLQVLESQTRPPLQHVSRRSIA